MRVYIEAQMLGAAIAAVAKSQKPITVAAEGLRLSGKAN